MDTKVEDEVHFGEEALDVGGEEDVIGDNEELDIGDEMEEVERKLQEQMVEGEDDISRGPPLLHDATIDQRLVDM